MILSLTSDTQTRGQIYDAASMVLQPALSQIEGVGQVTIGGGAAPAVRVELNPIAAVQIRHRPRGRARRARGGQRAQPERRDRGRRRAACSFTPTTRPTTPDDYQPLVIAYRNGAPVRLSDVATVEEGQEKQRNVGLSNGKPAVLVIFYRQPGGNIIDDRRPGNRQCCPSSRPRCRATSTSPSRSTAARRSALRCTRSRRTLLIAIGLVILVVFLFLRNARAALIPSVAVPVSLLGTFGAMYLLGYSLNNSSLMALTISTGFVVDDAIVVLENVTRHVEAGMGRVEAALRGAREIAFTVVSMSLSLIAVFVPILLMRGI